MKGKVFCMSEKEFERTRVIQMALDGFISNKRASELLNLSVRQVIRLKNKLISIYHDKHTIFRSPKREKLSIEEELLGMEKPLTQFGRAMKELGIIQVFADTPQAKGRVERCFETLQDRLVQELKLEGIKEMEKANEFLKDFIKRGVIFIKLKSNILSKR